MRRISAVLLCAVLLAGCASYHAVVVTDIQPGPRKVEDKWADAYLGGLVAPDTVKAATQCGEGGVALVETRISFLNSLVSTLTLGIYSPMEITVTCGAANESDESKPQGGVAPETKRLERSYSSATR